MVGNDCLRPLAPAVRARLSQFLVDTERYSEPAPPSQIDDEISALMISFRSARTISAAEAEATVAAYIDVLRGLPLWAIRNGFRRVKLGEVEGVSLDFPPAAPRLRKVVTDEMIPLRADRTEVTRVLAAREAPPENLVMADRVKETIAATAGGLNPMQAKFGADYGLNAARDPTIAEPKKSTASVPAWGSIVKRYAASAGRIQWLADRLKVMRGELADTPEVPLCGPNDVRDERRDDGKAA